MRSSKYYARLEAAKAARQSAPRVPKLNAIPSKVYILQGEPGIKIGRALRPDARARTLSLEYKTPITVVYQTRILADASQVEAHAHRLLARYKTFRKEWFSCSLEEAIEVVTKL